MADALYATADLCIELSKYQTRDELNHHIVELCPHFGATNFVVGVRGAFPATKDPVEYRATNFPQGFRDFYDKLGVLDPVIFRAVTKPGAFRWEEVEHVQPKQQELLAARIRYGMEHGFSCAAQGPQGFVGLVNFASTQRQPDELWPRIATALDILAVSFTRAAVAMLECELRQANLRESLSASEIAALELTAQGLTAEEVGARLNVSKHTIRYHLDSAADKLGCRNKREVVAEALSLGVIRKRHFADPKFSQTPGDSDSAVNPTSGNTTVNAS